MKTKFITRFFQILWEMVQEAPRTISNLLVYESMARKNLRMGGIDPRTFYLGISNLKKRGLLTANKNCYAFTPKGRAWLKKPLLQHKKSIYRSWDKKWRIILFDVPQEFHNKRVAFQRNLKKLGFYMLQKSVFAYPYPCQDEISELINRLEIGDYVSMLIASSVGQYESKLKDTFGL
ncbi:MAG: CRISPR-associated endonuclease Cas2 [Candidatus Yanofskybacteria bacterium RIFCSPHIGHO2_01_FULL_45_42]|uniref:CRISPR-associated endonuclease Cas2 n=3 Tax=Candidatus Yanofskyibacteriota TaxID=1752733 RepID=A0A1F8F403_9BACT|nr:MAG: CRISPR-associated endonuclease Cas2 [Candidatus Yanofskybacteria bacterium RIFCSPHIGHO2_01_FULL_45_42]OGN15851.1 MAG: CRISPR-associated endonuclease Cas2 [Candidatus Yanofskybacteria bacterium RIFCSPHIGHO2_02_FULL_46_19]OGN27428.1 MAG: CRISPR-associated endonuclease Cas2 [Candidatus Yanofskybacteria bacterium RIFCSPLOWO2_01_FULL_45_72]OGN32289.1 MAG: CRISPR-associated endonuclease Cas2 [Candidatus Yanofskybacteria bacterium RIFCSPLOWO2_02_FULL_45_18]